MKNIMSDQELFQKQRSTIVKNTLFLKRDDNTENGEYKKYIEYNGSKFYKFEIANNSSSKKDEFIEMTAQIELNFINKFKTAGTHIFGLLVGG